MGSQLCQVEGCDRPRKSRGYCKSHYERWRLQGDNFRPTPLRSYGDTSECNAEGCTRTQKSRGLCKAHYDRAKLGLPLDTPIRPKAKAGATVEEAFDLWAAGPPTSTGCIEWTGGVLPSGYGSLNVSGAAKLAHRMSWEIANDRPVPSGKVVRHSCDNRLCVNADHLLIGTALQNSGDMVIRDRQAKGDRVPTAKMTDESVIDLLRQRQAGASYRQLAKQFGIGTSQVSNIVHGRSWRHVPRA